MTLTVEQVEVSADPREQYEQAIAERWSDGVPMLPATDDAVEALLAATPYPADHALCVLPPRNGVATVELIAVNAAMAGCEPAAFPYVIAALEAISEPEWNAFGLTTTTSSVFPMLLVNGPSRDDARHRLPRRVHGRRGRPGLDDDRPRGVAVPAQHRRPARGGDHQDGVRPARALRLLHRRVGGTVAVAEPRASGAATPPTRTS